MRDALSSLVDRAAEPGDAAAYAIVLGSIAQILPSIASVLSILWLVLRIWESDTVRSITGRVQKPKQGADE